MERFEYYPFLTTTDQ